MNPGLVMISGALLVNAAAILLAAVAVAGLNDYVDLVAVLLCIASGVAGFSLPVSSASSLSSRSERRPQHTTGATKAL